MRAIGWDAVVLAGGSARRLGGADKMTVEVGGRPLLDRVVAAVAAADRVIVVGPQRTTRAAVVWTREEPPGGGPVAGIAAGLSLVTADRVVMLAGDLPFVTTAVVDALLASVGGDADGTLLVDVDGVPQLLCGAWRTAALYAALAGLATPAGTSVRRLLRGLRVRAVPAPATGPPPWLDCDTPADVAAANELA